MKHEKGQPEMELVGIVEKHLHALCEDGSAWYETPEEIRAGLQWGRVKAELLRWVRCQMNRELSPRERRCIELHYFACMNCRDIANELEIPLSCAHRALARGLHRLRFIAQERNKSWRRLLPRRGSSAAQRAVGLGRIRTGNKGRG